MSGKRTEHCGRCTMSSVVDLTETTGDEDGAEAAHRDPFGGDRIEVSEEQLRAVSPAAWVSGLVSRLDDAATRLVYGSR